jgi:hypothetical protein
MIHAKWGRMAVFFTAAVISGILRMKYSPLVAWDFVVGAAVRSASVPRTGVSQSRILPGFTTERAAAGPLDIPPVHRHC